jgi:hypothetical protein
MSTILSADLKAYIENCYSLYKQKAFEYQSLALDLVNELAVRKLVSAQCLANIDTT